MNPDVDARTHPHISTGLRDNKFGIAWDDAVALYREAAAHAGLEVVGIDCHIGSQIVQLAPYLDAADRLLDLLDRLQAGGIRLRHIDFGGGLGIAYRDEQPPAVAELIAALLARVDAHGHGDKRLIVEPGRSIAGPAGVLLTRANLLKPGPGRHFVVVDAAMNDLLRPAMYDAWMAVEPVQAREDSVVERVYDVVGPVCESADCLARDRRLRITAGDLLVVRDAGAYGMSMAGNYNSRPRAAEVMVDGDRVHLVRRRETFADLIAGESRLPDPP